MNTQLNRVVVVAPEAEKRVPVLTFVDEVKALLDVDVTVVDASSDGDIDSALNLAFGAAQPMEEPLYPRSTVLVVAGADGVVRAVARRATKRVTPPASRRPDWLAERRTMGDLPPLAILPLSSEQPSLAHTLGLPTSPSEVAKAVAFSQPQPMDLLRNDHGSVTVHGVMLGQADEQGRTLPWRARVDVDAANLCDGHEPILACAIANAAGYSQVTGLTLLKSVDPADGLIEVAVAVPAGNLVEVRRATGRAVAVDPAETISCTDDGVDAELSRKKTWWMESKAWSIFAP